MRSFNRLSTGALAMMLAVACPLHANAQQMPWDPPAGETPAQIPFEIQPDANQGQPTQEQPAEEPAPQQPAQTDQPGQQQPAQSKPTPEAKVERVANPVAEFSGIDKITGRIINFDVYIDETVQFGALQVTPRVCYSRPGAEAPKTDSFVEVDEITLDRKIRRIFTGWMFAESPGINAVEHAVYDVWLKGCKQKSDVPAPAAAKPSSNGAPAKVNSTQSTN
ncbi:DUF2155 domain-containing protein [Mesorhizobium retamae]|uniref:DUF2155 domain-containing protein n=1 Tax=Mesorhizobium retamae TaxID=2912854 RepID=A0ABS9QCJ9_9HYPH|nr:DUF2155 domain-containing protein [Mesorhizobium sp. IRAMC:0171]MCG7505141.1 DUF2155 domain-containing protein [Mesorhizobium sp. IRAMC:0171]